MASSSVKTDLNVLVVDDTVLYRRILTDVVNSIPDASVVDTAMHGKLALDKLEQMPVDVVLLDVEMPVMDGLATLEVIRAKYPDIGVIMVSGVNKNAADITMKALSKGALDFVPKPECASPEASREALVEGLKPLLKLYVTRRSLRTARQAMAGTPVPIASVPVPPGNGAVAPKPAAPKPAPPAAMSRLASPPARIDVLGIGVSTGGPNALREMIPRLPGDLGVPVLLVQHMPPVFTKSLADSLAKVSAIDVREASDGESVQANTVYIAPGGRHMVVRRKTGDGGMSIALNDNPPENSCRPAVDVLFRSIAANYEGNMLAVVMTGMGSDGREGVRAMRRQGCYCITQSEESCVVYGMPQAVDEAGLSHERVPLGGLAARIAAAVKKPGGMR